MENAGDSQDICATRECLSALLDTDGGTRRLDCGESGTTLRFLLPLAGVLCADAEFVLRGRLHERPIEPLARELCAHGMRIERQENMLRCSGALRPGAFTLRGDVSSQFISGLLMALPMLSGDSTLNITGQLQSAPYVAMTLEALKLSGISIIEIDGGYHIPGGQSYDAPEIMTVEGDWSNAAPFLCMGALSHGGITVTGLNPESVQGDRAIVQILRELGAVVEVCGDRVSVRRWALHGAAIDAAMIPDIIPALAALAATADGETRIINAGRLRLKESDRLGGTARLLCALGADACIDGDSLIIRGWPELAGGMAETESDHRMAMAAAVAACACREAVTVTDPGCVSKSYPGFWDDLSSLEADT